MIGSKLSISSIKNKDNLKNKKDIENLNFLLGTKLIIYMNKINIPPIKIKNKI